MNNDERDIFMENRCCQTLRGRVLNGYHFIDMNKIDSDNYAVRFRNRENKRYINIIVCFYEINRQLRSYFLDYIIDKIIQADRDIDLKEWADFLDTGKLDK